MPAHVVAAVSTTVRRKEERRTSASRKEGCNRAPASSDEGNKPTESPEERAKNSFQNKDDEMLARLRSSTTSVKSALAEKQAQAALAGEGPKEYWTQSNRFNVLVGAVIFGNAICLGVEADFGWFYKSTFNYLEHFFCAAFSIELLLHFGVEGPKVYFSDKANWLDFVLVTSSVSDIWVIQQIGVKADLKLLSLLRMLRLARLARLLRLFRIFKELTMIVEGFVAGARALSWAMVFLGILVYAFAIFARLQIGSRYICPDGQTELPEGETCPGGELPDAMYEFDGSDQKSLFGSVDKTMLTLFICLTEGCGLDVVHPTVMTSAGLGFFWLIFIFVTTFGVLNQIIGLFCENSMKIALETEREMKASEDEQRMEQIEVMRRAFKRMDEDGTGDISKDEFMKAITEDDEVIQCMEAIGLDEEADLFDSLDADHSGSLEFEEFFQGVVMIMKGQDPAMAKDMVATHLRVVALWKHQELLEKKVDQVREAQATSETQMDAKIDQLLEAQARLSKNLDVWFSGGDSVPSSPSLKSTTPSPDIKKGQSGGQVPAGVELSAEAPPALKLFAEPEEPEVELVEVEDLNGVADARPGFIPEYS